MKQPDKRYAKEKLEQIVNKYFEETGDWAAATGLAARFQLLIDEYYEENNND